MFIADGDEDYGEASNSYSPLGVNSCHPYILLTTILFKANENTNQLGRMYLK